MTARQVDPVTGKPYFRWVDVPDGPRVAYTHGPEGLILGLAGKQELGPVFATSGEAAEDARKVAALRETHRVVYKLVPISYHRFLSGRVE